MLPTSRPPLLPPSQASWRAVVTRPLFAAYRKMLPQMSQTEKDAIEAGSVWWEGELFHGRPDWSKLLA